MTVALFLFFKVRFKNPVTQNLINRIAVFVLIVTGIVLPQIIGSIQTDYSHKSQFLSELGATDAPYQLLNNYGSLLPIGIAAFVLVFGLYNKFPRTRLVTVGITLLFAVGISYLSGFFFACDPGCPVTGSLKQNLHNLFGLVHYLSLITGLFLIFLGLRKSAPKFSIFTLVITIIILIGFLQVVNGEMQDWQGAWQRLSEYSLALWFFGTVFWYKRPRSC